MTLAAVAREAAVSQILRYELYRHESLTERIRRIAPAAAQQRMAPRSHQATWQIIFYMCRCYYTGHRPTVTDVYLSAGISKVTAIKRLRDLGELGIVTIESDTVDRRRKHAVASPALRRALDRFVDDYVGDLRRMVGDARGADAETDGRPRWLPHERMEGGAVPRTAFLGDFSHEIRIALNSIIGFADAIRGEVLGPVTPQGYREYANDIYGAGRHLQALVSDLVEMAQAALTDGQPLTYEEIDAGEVVADVLAATRETARAVGVGVGARVAPDLPPLRADGRRLRQVLLSLVGHAIRHNGTGSRVTVETENGHDAIRFRIRNVGNNVAASVGEPAPPPFVEKLMQPRSSASGEAGQTLGLALSRSLVEILGGELRFEKGADGTADATVELPLTPVRESEPETADSVPMSTAGNS